MSSGVGRFVSKNYSDNRAKLNFLTVSYIAEPFLYIFPPSAPCCCPNLTAAETGSPVLFQELQRHFGADFVGEAAAVKLCAEEAVVVDALEDFKDILIVYVALAELAEVGVDLLALFHALGLEGGVGQDVFEMGEGDSVLILFDHGHGVAAAGSDVCGIRAEADLVGIGVLEDEVDIGGDHAGGVVMRMYVWNDSVGLADLADLGDGVESIAELLFVGGTSEDADGLNGDELHAELEHEVDLLLKIVDVVLFGSIEMEVGAGGGKVVLCKRLAQSLLVVLEDVDERLGALKILVPEFGYFFAGGKDTLFVAAPLPDSVSKFSCHKISPCQRKMYLLYYTTYI